MRRVLLPVLALPLAAAGPGPLGVTLMGSVKSAVVAAPKGAVPANVCMINAGLNAGATGFAANGPALALYRRDRSSGPVALTVPLLGYGGLTGSVSAPSASLAFSALGGMRLKFATEKTGTISFLAGGVTLPDSAIAPSFSNYTAVWVPKLKRLTVSFDLHMGKCAVPFIAGFEA